ncbi:general transcription factor 3C polypeptide 1-like isoform X2 [Corythoichthys intestinalis]|uniref:general transcription factor 3C polypeptide 1-like isoform X2 n=1 Tax=Corythoichthys intestinalis TaxID=161448 RepID=UPI0025A4F162|nr:general transcription factor 3C polypeptide 1-like isoform X2 [Corythoichthys intestinalis]XP_061791808.1 general transcription factor 3C polypeptide 1-like [Nerophis lumbriciformis]
MDPLGMVEDEVALEGLDGITIPTLWIRLEDRNPKFPLKLDDGTKEFVWRSLVANTDLTFYRLPVDRDDVVLYDRFKTSPDGSHLDVMKDVYPLHVVQDNKDGIQGSCATFSKRTDITARLRSPPPICLDEVLKRYGRKLVVVASQKLRFRALIGSESDPDTKLMDDSYCMLERVGRGRWQGELQSDLHKSAFKVDARKLHYIRKSLDRHGLLIIQPFTKRLPSGQKQSSMLLLLKRFNIIRRSKYDMLMEYVSTLLQKMPRQLAALVTIREHLNMPETMCKRIFRCMRDNKLVEYCNVPLEELDEEGGDLRNKSGKKVQVRCLKLLKVYTGKVATGGEEWKEDEDDDEDDEVDRRRGQPPVGHIMEKDILSQAYDLVLSSGTLGIPQSGVRSRMNIGRLEARMICRKLEKDGIIKGFMVDEGRQRVTRFIGHRSVGGSNHLQLLSKEKQRKKLFHSSTSPASPSGPEASPANGKQPQKTPKKSKAASKGEEKKKQDTSLESGGKKSRQKPAKESEATLAEAAPSPVLPATQPDSTSEHASAEEKQSQEESLPPHQEKEGNASNGATDIMEVDSVYRLPISNSNRSQETYRVLRRKNLIIEAVHKFKVIDGLYQLQKLINEEEKLQGFTTKCCKKTTARLVQTLSREGLLKIFTTTVIQDGISRKLEMFVHPSVQPKDKLVTDSIDQARFKISSSCSAPCQQKVSSDSVRRVKTDEPSKSFRSFSEVKKEYKKEYKKEEAFKPPYIRGLGKTLGFQPKMHRLRVLHSFLWYVTYDHPMGPRPTRLTAPQVAAVVDKEPQDTKEDDVPQKDLEAALSGDDDETQTETASHSKCDIKVYSEEDSWKRFVPPVRTHSDRGSGWVLVGDLLHCLPLSIFIQLIQINYQVDGLEEYLNDPVKQHHLVWQLPLGIRRKLFYKRKYVFIFFENLQRLVCMGLMQFAPVEKMKEKDQLFCYLKRCATIVDTTNAEPHYWLVSEPTDSPFDRRRYTFNSTDDVDTYWFDLMCVCLNTPLGLIRPKRGASEDDAPPSFVHERSVFVGMASLLKGSYVVSDDGTTPGNGKGAGGLDSEFFAHLKRNWLWTNHLLGVKQRPGMTAKVEKARVRLKSLLSKESMLAALKAGASLPRFLTAKKMVVAEENVEVAIEPASRNQEVVGGKCRKRKRLKKQVVKVPRKKKKEPKKRTPAHDEADHRALKKMTRQRVFWTLQEDSLLMLCAVASHLLNSKLRRLFVAHCLVRDLLQASFNLSEDKTSVAVGRRTRYILKNPQTFLNYRTCLAEIYQDKDLLNQLQENKPVNPNDADDCAKSFNEYVKLLRNKFSSVINADDVKLPATKQQLFSQFKVCTIQSDQQIPSRDDLTCTTDIHKLVLFNLIQSTLAMTNYQMKSSRSFQTFQIYSQYPQELLCQVFIQCRKRHMVNRRRVHQSTGPKKNRALPILPMSFQLSQSYYRLFSWRFPHTLCTDTFRFLRSLLNNGSGDERPAVSYFHETENRVESGEEAPERPLPVVTEEAEGSPNSGSEPSGMMRYPLDSPGGACMVSLTLMSLGLLSVHLSIPKKMVVVDSNLVDTDVKSMATLEEEDDEDDDVAGGVCEGKKKRQVTAHQASHTKYLLMKGFCFPGIVKLRNLSTNENIVVESCGIMMRLRQTPGHGFLKDAAHLELSKTGPSLLPSVLTRCIQNVPLTPAQRSGYSPEDLQASAQLRKSLDEAGEMGVDQTDLFQQLAHLRLPISGRSRSLVQYLGDLQEDGQILQVGGYGIRWVLTEHAEPWILSVNSGDWHQPQVPSGKRRSQHNIPFIRKRRRRLAALEDDKTEGEPPSKKLLTDEIVEKEEAQPVMTEGEDHMEKVTTERESGENDEKNPPLKEDETEDVEKDREAPPVPQVDPHEEMVSFISRPWRLVDGTLNRQVCKGMLEGLLYHIMSRPGIPEWRLLSHYEDVLQPVVVLDLVQSLIELGCITKKTLIKKAKPTLFGTPVTQEQTEEKECVFYEPTVSCCLRLAQVLPNERNWNYCHK